MTAYWLERALVDGAIRDSVRVEIDGGLFSSVRTDAVADGADGLAGLTIPGLANCHSHAFHRALRGRTQRGRGTFWTWREQMYAAAERLDPDTYYALARATYREMVVGGITTVGEFHYLHHGPDGTPYDDPNEMGRALMRAAEDAGIRIVLLDTCYLAAGIGREPEGVQRRFSDGSADAWAARVDTLRRGVTNPSRGVTNVAASAACRAVGDPSTAPEARVGAAVHSVRAVPRDDIPVVAAWADEHNTPLHMHLSEQVDDGVAVRAEGDR